MMTSRVHQLGTDITDNDIISLRLGCCFHYQLHAQSWRVTEEKVIPFAEKTVRQSNLSTLLILPMNVVVQDLEIVAVVPVAPSPSATRVEEASSSLPRVASPKLLRQWG